MPSWLVSTPPSLVPSELASTSWPMSGGPKATSALLGLWPPWMSALTGLAGALWKPIVSPPVLTASVLWPSAVRLWPAPTNASTRLVTTGTPTAAPIPAEPPSASVPATLVTSRLSLAEIWPLPRTCRPPAPRLATASDGSSPTNARVTTSATSTLAAPAMPAPPPPPPAAATETTSSRLSASTCRLPCTLPLAAEPIDASVTFEVLVTAAPAPTPPEPPAPIEPATVISVVLSSASR